MQLGRDCCQVLPMEHGLLPKTISEFLIAKFSTGPQLSRMFLTSSSLFQIHASLWLSIWILETSTGIGCSGMCQGPPTLPGISKSCLSPLSLTFRMPWSSTLSRILPSFLAFTARLENHTHGIQNLLWGEFRLSNFLCSSGVMRPGWERATGEGWS